jgi:PPOX class probable F420-dependent enzyme
MTQVLSEEQQAFVSRQRLAHLGTADAQGRPHVVPVCFALDAGAIWIAIDEKPKRTHRLKRLRNIAENPSVSLVFDTYDEDWTRLGYVLVQGRAEVVQGGAEQQRAIAALRTRYPQYAGMKLEELPAIRVTPEKVASWGKLD